MSQDFEVRFQIPQMWHAKIERLTAERRQPAEAILQSCDRPISR
ncbi:MULTISPECIES: hypothetical protein [Desertifilum]|nr:MULTISPECIES: hypothetical protein [Desertifilum]MDA0208634.1 hypothetical protein [Cyanobacteria bacterium FC1]